MTTDQIGYLIMLTGAFMVLFAAWHGPETAKS